MHDACNTWVYTCTDDLVCMCRISCETCRWEEVRKAKDQLHKIEQQLAEKTRAQATSTQQQEHQQHKSMQEQGKTKGHDPHKDAEAEKQRDAFDASSRRDATNESSKRNGVKEGGQRDAVDESKQRYGKNGGLRDGIRDDDQEPSAVCMYERMDVACAHICTSCMGVCVCVFCMYRNVF